jgi:hypothetical protein
LIKDVIKIARNAKENKLGIYSEQKVELSAIKLKEKSSDLCETSRKTKREDTLKKTQVVSRLKNFQ